tara:strand:+ start:478 stop:663 length:186 start_codon:yes stop_codon:yes gene_type:complete
MLHIACMAPMSDGITYPDFSSCVLAGSKTASEVIINLTPEDINKDQLYVQFACVKKPDIEL